MRKLNTSLLTAAVVGVLALPGLASAATLSYTAAAPGVQTTYAWELFTDNGITIKTPDNLALVAQAFDNANLGTITAGEALRVKVTLTNGAKFDTGIPAATFAAAFTEGNQTGGAGAAVAIVAGSEFYSTTGHELNFVYNTTGAGNTANTTPAAITAGAYLLGMPTVQLNNLVQGLSVGRSVGMEITVQDNTNVQVFAASSVIVRSAYGVTVDSDPLAGDTTKFIDVAAQPVRRTLFGTSIPGSSATATPAYRNFFNAGSVTVDITSAARTREPAGGFGSYVNNYDPTVAPGVYNVVNTAVITIRVKGSNLATFGSSRAWLSAAGVCDIPAASRLVGTVNAAGDTITFTSNASDARWAALTAAIPGPVTHSVCLASGGPAMSPQELSGEFDINYNLPTQRQNPPTQFFDLLPLRLNGTEIIFQNVNPAANASAQSFLRITNNNTFACPLALDAKDDAGNFTGFIEFTLPAHQSIHVNSDDLENGNTAKGLTGSWGDGTGRWYVRITADCTNIKASALNRNASTGVVTDLTPEKLVGRAWTNP